MNWRFWRRTVIVRTEIRYLHLCTSDWSYCPEFSNWRRSIDFIQKNEEDIKSFLSRHATHDLLRLEPAIASEYPKTKKRDQSLVVEPGIWRVMIAHDGEIVYDKPENLVSGKIVLKLRKDSGF